MSLSKRARMYNVSLPCMRCVTCKRLTLTLLLAQPLGLTPLTEYAAQLRMPARRFNGREMQQKINAELSSRLTKSAPSAKPEVTPYILRGDNPRYFLNAEAFAKAGVGEAEAETMVGDALVRAGALGFVTRVQLAAGNIPANVFTEKLRNSYSPLPSWFVFAYSRPFLSAYESGTGHGLPYSYDSHVPLVFYGQQFQPGVYRQPVQPTDLAVTLSSLLGVNKPATATGSVRWESMKPTTAKPAAAKPAAAR